MHIHTYTNNYTCDYVLTSWSFSSLQPGHPGVWLVNWAVLTSRLSLPDQQQDGSIAVNCEIDGLQAVCVAELIEFPHQTPAVWTWACHNMHTYTHSPHQVLCLYLNWQLPYYYFSYLSNRWGISLTCSALFLSSFCFIFPALFQALSGFLQTAVWSDSVMILQGRNIDCNTGSLTSCFSPLPSDIR